MKIDITLIRLDGGTQPREAIDYGVVQEYAEAIEAGATFPAVTVYYDGADYWLADGFHRVAAYGRAKREQIDAEVHQGSRRDAVLHSVGANSNHGLRRTNPDKRRAVMTLLRDEEWAQWSDREIARRCGVSDRFVNSIRASVTANRSQSEPAERTYTTKHGTTATMNTENIGRKKPEPVDDEPEDFGFYTDDSDDEDETIDTTVDYAIDHIWDYVTDILSELPTVTEKHAVVNEVLKRVRQLSIQYNQQA